MLTIQFSSAADKSYKDLPRHIKNKADRQFKRILLDFKYPSLRVKKMKGYQGIFEARIDRNYRFAFSLHGVIIYIHTLGLHDEGLGKK